MKQSSTYNDSVRASYAAADARRILNDLPPALYRDVTDFAASGLPADAPTVTEWLESRGTYGYVDTLVADIIRHQKSARAAAAAV